MNAATKTFLALCCLSAPAQATETIAPGWQITDAGFGTRPAFDLDSQGNIHLVSMIEDRETGGVFYDTATSIHGPWDLQPVATGYYYAPPAVLVDPADTVHIAWHSHGSGGPTGGPVHATIQPGGATNITAIQSPRHDGWDPSLALDSQGNLHLATMYPSSYNTPASLQHGVHNGTAWQHDTIADSGLFIFGHSTSIGIDSAGRPRIAYTDADTYTGPGNLMLATLDAGSWAFDTLVDGLASGVPAGRFPSLAIDAQDRVHLAWIDLDPANSLLGTVRYGRLDGGDWTTETVDSLESIRVGSINGRRQVSLQLDASGEPRIGYGDRRSVRFAERIDDAWSITPVAESTGVLYNGQVDLRLDSSGEPILAFWQTHPTEPGLVRLAAPAPDPSADFDGDGDTDLADLLALQIGYGITEGATTADGDADGDGDVDDQDLTAWKDAVKAQPSVASAPEPTASMLAALAAVLIGCGTFGFLRNVA